jgi:glycosyltransferase involved in cell wall biosynthesis
VAAAARAARQGARVVVVMPAYNAAATLVKTYESIPPGACDAVVLVDDRSSDETADLAERLNLTTLRHRHNRGYGGNQKTCYTKALELGADVVVMLHPDNQYDPSIIPDLVAPIAAGKADIVLASRFLGRPLAGGMPLYKYIFNRGLTLTENLVLGQRFSEYHTGYRAFSREALLALNFEANSEDFVFDNEIIVQGVLAGLRFTEVPVRTHYATDSSSVGVGTSLRYGLGCLRVMLESILHRTRLATFKRYPRKPPRLVPGMPGVRESRPADALRKKAP